MFEPVVAPFHHVAPGVDHWIEGQRTTRSGRAPSPLVGTLRNGVRDLALTQEAAAARITVALVGDEPVRPGPWASRPPGSTDANAVQDRLQLRTVMAASRSDDDGKPSPLAVTGEGELCRQPAAAAPNHPARRTPGP